MPEEETKTEFTPKEPSVADTGSETAFMPKKPLGAVEAPESALKATFVPKKPLGVPEEKPRARAAKAKQVGLISFLSTIIFIAALAGGVGVYFYKLALTNKVRSMAENLERARGIFEPELIEEMTILDKRINAAQTILSSHVALSPLFELLEDLTLPAVRFTHFNFSSADNEETIIEISGIADGYQSVARQSELFDQNKYIKDQLFSNLTVDRKTGNVTFNLSFVVDKTFLLYSRSI